MISTTAFFTDTQKLEEHTVTIRFSHVFLYAVFFWQIILSLGADIHERNPYSETPMTLAALEGHLSIVKVH